MMMKILMVCLGNICRSPLAEGILRDKFKKRKIAAEVYSSGTSDFHLGERPDPRTIEVAEEHHIDIRSHRGNQFTVGDFDKYDKIFTMDLSNFLNVLKLARNEKDRSKVEMILNVSNPGMNMEVTDPYFGGNNGFELVYRMLDQACEIIANSVETK
jgi:protein-tyrosine phosphatase